MKIENLQKLSDEELIKIVTEDFRSYSSKEITAAIEELKRRDYEFDKEVLDDVNQYLLIAELSDEKLIEIIGNHWNYPQFSVEEVERELAKREIKIDEKDFEKKVKKLESTEVSRRQPVDIGTESISKRYPALRIIAGIYNVLAWIVGIVAVIGTLYWVSKGKEGVVLSLSFVIIGAIGVITLLAMSEGIKVFIDIEENTRKTAESLKKR